MADEKAKKPKKTIFSLQGFDVNAYKQTEGYVHAINALYNQAVQEFATVAGGVNFNPDKPFSFADYPQARNKAQQIINGLAAKMEGVIKNGSRNQWLYACKKNDEFLNHILNTSKVPKKQLAKYQDRNMKALDAFQTRKINGLDLSKRIWNYTGQLQTQMELGIDIALGEGKSAAQLSRDLRQYLVDPDKLFHKVKDKHGMLHISKNAAAFNPGQGKYRSSYKNAMRLTRSEINMAYRESDWLRWQNLDFVVGFEVKLSNNHTTLINGVPTPFTDICDELKGRYPKWFKWTSWHPQCRCHCIPIMKTDEEMDQEQLADLRAAWKGEAKKQFQSKNQVNDVPDNFKKFLSDKAEVSAGWKSQPYWVRDNFKDGTIAGGLKVATIEPMKVVQPVIQKPTIQPLYEAVTSVEATISRNKSFETAVAFDKDGNEVFRKKGGKTSVAFTLEEVSKFKDTVLTHNHPIGWENPENSIGRVGSSFSPADIKIAIAADMAEIRACGPVFTFIMKRPKGGWPISETEFLKIQRKVDYDMQDELGSLIRNSDRAHKDKVIERANAIHYHLVWKRFCKMYGIEYTKVKNSR